MAWSSGWTRVAMVVCVVGLLMAASLASGERRARRKLKVQQPASAADLAAAGGEGSGELKVEVSHRPDACERKTKAGDIVDVHYVGQLADGQTFDSSFARQEPITLALGQGQVIPGWEQGLLGMCVDEMRKLTVPPHLAYGEQGYPPVIPPHATLTFLVQLVAFKN